MKDLISIIVPIYNVENYLDRCVKSILAQTYKNIELILVDDGSTDSCPAMCDTYKKKDNRIKVVHKINGGLSDARNAGMKIAVGEFYLFVDSDDYIEAELCEKCMENMNDDIDIISFNFRRVYDNNNQPKYGNGALSVYDNIEGFKRYINRNPFTHMAWDKMYRKQIFEGVEFTLNRLAEDMSTIYKTFGKANKVAHLDNSFYNYYFRSNSIMGEKSLKLLLDAYMGECEAFEYGNAHFPELENQNNTRFFNQSMKTYLKLIKIYSGNNKAYKEKDAVLDNINRIHIRKLPFKTRLFYMAFSLNKNIAWLLFNMFHLS